MEKEMKRQQGTEAERQLAWSREYLRQEKRRRLLRRTLLMLVLALVCAVTVFAMSGGISALRVGGAPASSTSGAPSSSSVAAAQVPSSASQASVQPAVYTVTFDSRGGSAVDALQNVTQGARAAAPAAPVREGYTFAGWYKDIARTQAWNFATDTVEQDTTLYAKWEAVPAQDASSGAAALPQTGVATGALLWAGVLAAALALAAVAAVLLRRAYRGRN